MAHAPQQTTTTATMEKPSAATAAAAKRKRGEKVPGGLVINRLGKPASASTHAPQPQPPAPIQPPSQPLPSTSARPPSRTAVTPPVKRRRTSGASSMATGAPVSVREPLVDEDIARMDDEARELRKARLSPVAAANPEFVVPAPALHATREKTPLARKTKPRARARDGPGDDGEGGRGRGADRAESSTHRRKSSLSARGKRASSAYSETGVITHPHPHVPASSFHKHIDGDQPEAARLAQLLIWCSAKKSGPSDTPARALPPLSAKGQEIMQAVQEGMTRALAERRVDTAPYSRPPSQPPANKSDSAQNVFNRRKHAYFQADIDRAKHEDAAWAQVGAYYDAHQTSVLSSLAARSRDKGKARSDIHPGDLPLRFTGEGGLALANKIMQEHEALLSRDPNLKTSHDALDARMAELAYKIDTLHSRVHDHVAATKISELEITARFADVSLASRSTPAATVRPTSNAHPPPAPGVLEDGEAPPLGPVDPRELLRAVARHEHERAQRAPEGVPHQLRSVARDIQRAADTGAGLVPPATPRRGGSTGLGGGTPAAVRRAPGTPGRLR